MHCRPLTEIILHILILRGKVRGLREEDMAACFKFPSLPKKRRRAFEFPKFSWNSVKIKEELGSGYFGPSIWRILNLEKCSAMFAYRS